MRKSCLTLLFVFITFLSFCQADTVLQKKVDALNANVTLLKSSLDSLKSKAKSPSDSSKLKANLSNQCYDCTHPLSWKQRLLVLSPIVLFFLVLLYLALRLRNEGFKLADALDETTPKIKTIENPQYNVTTAVTGTVPPTINVTDSPNRSTSRLIAFLSGLAAILIAVSSASYFFYMYFRTGHEPDISKLYYILLALGIGVTPYVFNKLSEAIRPNKE